MKAKTVFLSAALAVALAAASAAHAVDVKVYAGHACQAQLGTQAADLIHNAIFLVAAADQHVVCPIVRDNHKNLDGVKSVAVRVQSPNGTPVSCYLYSFDALGSTVEINSNSTTSTAVTNLLLDINTSTKGGAYSLGCYLSSGSRIRGYEVTEF